MSNDKPASAPDGTPAADTKAPPPPAKAVAKTGGRTRSRLLSVLAVAALGMGGYLYWKLQQSPPPSVADYAAPTDAPTSAPVDARGAQAPAPVEQAPDEQAADVPADTLIDDSLGVDTPASDSEEPAAPLTSAPLPAAPVEPAPVADANLSALLTRIAELEASVAALAAAPAPSSTDTGTLVIGEAGDLVALAEQRIALARDTRGAMAALRLAASRLVSGEFQAQRRAILADLAALEAFRDVDVAALAAELALQARQAASLPLAGQRPASSDALLAAPPEVDGWRSLVAAVWGSLRGLVEVREADDGRDPLLNHAHAAFARQQLALDLSAARIAVLQRDANEFRAALAPAIDTLQTQFDTADSAVNAALARLRELGAVDLAPVLPSVTRSVDALAVAPPSSPAAPPEPAL